MKKFLALTIAFVSMLSLVSCNDGDSCNDSIFKVAPDSITFGANDQESRSFDVISTSNVSWKAEVEPAAQEWLTITADAGKVMVSVAENVNPDQRTGKIVITPNGGIEPAEVVVTQNSAYIISIAPTTVLLQFWADFFKCGLSNYYLVMGSGDAEYFDFNETVSVYNGYIVTFDMFTNVFVPELIDKIDIDEGTYRCLKNPNKDIDFAYETMSFLPTFTITTPGLIYFDGSGIDEYIDGQLVKKYIIETGEITVKKAGDDYDIAAELRLDTGEIVYIGYSGAFDDKVLSGYYSTYEEELDISGANTGTIEYYGELPDNMGCYHWYVMMEVPGYDNVTGVYLSLYSPMTDVSAPDDGEYTFASTPPYEPYSIEAGYVSMSYPIASWIVGYDGDYMNNYSPLIGGTVNLTHSGGDNYTIEMDAFMDNYISAKVHFKGSLEYIDKTTVEPSPYRGMPPVEIIRKP